MKRSFLKSLKIAAMTIATLCLLFLASCKNDDDNPVTPVIPNDTTLKVTSIAPATVSYGDTLVVNGDNFSTIAVNNIVTINDMNASVIAASATVLKVVIPALSHTTNEIKIQVGDNTVAGGTIAYIPDVFVAGTLNNSAMSLATYWKNGTSVAVSQNESGLNAIYVNANDVYVAGWERINNLQLANYWKNDTQTTLGTGESAIYAMAVNGTDVYTGGFEIINGFDLPRYWHNSTGITVNVNDPIISKVTLGNGACNGIYYSANNVYAVGSYRNSQGRFSPWETTNDEVPANTIPNNDKFSFANAVFVNGSDKYVVGNQNNATTGLAMATVWKNGNYTSLTDGINSVGVAKAVLAIGDDVYVAGYEQENYSGGGPAFAKYWKNGVPIKLSTASSTATGIAVFDGDVYVTGWEDNGNRNVVKYWKNGVAVSLTDGTFTSAGNSIFVR